MVGVPHTSKSFLSGVRALNISSRLVESDVNYLPLPLFHIIGLLKLLGSCCAGSSILMPSAASNPASAILAVQEHACTRLGVVPTILRALLDHLELQKAELKFIVGIETAGAVLPPDLLQDCLVKFGPRCRVTTPYGSTEGAPFLAPSYEDPPLRPEAISSGKPAAGAKVRICESGSKQYDAATSASYMSPAFA